MVVRDWCVNGRRCNRDTDRLRGFSASLVTVPLEMNGCSRSGNPTGVTNPENACIVCSHVAYTSQTGLESSGFVRSERGRYDELTLAMASSP